MIEIISFLIFVSVTLFIVFIYRTAKEKIFSLRLARTVGEEQKLKKKKSLSVAVRNLFSPVAQIQLPLLQKYKNRIDTQVALSKIKGLDFPLFLGVQVLAALFLVLFLVIVFETIGFFSLLVSITLAFLLPWFWLKSKVSARHNAIFRSLPDVLDLLTLMMTAGLDFGAALNKYLEKGKKGALYDELFLVQQEIRMGKTRVDALNTMSERTDHPALASVVSSLVQGIQLGSSLGPILKAQAIQLRTQRFQRAEKLASEAPVKMLFPLLFFIFPTIFIILFGPIVLSFLQ